MPSVQLYGRPQRQNRVSAPSPCRWKYNLVEEHRPGQYMEIGETRRNGSYILNANDLCTAPFIDLICKAGDSLKIEGRAKTFYYVASVISAYRRALDAFALTRTMITLSCPMMSSRS